MLINTFETNLKPGSYSLLFLAMQTLLPKYSFHLPYLELIGARNIYMMSWSNMEMSGVLFLYNKKKMRKEGKAFHKIKKKGEKKKSFQKKKKKKKKKKKIINIV